MSSPDLPEPPPASSDAVRRVMQGNRHRDTTPELAIRRRVHARGLRYRVDVSPPVEGMSRRRVDMLFPREKVAVQIYGCFWHGCTEHGSIPRTNTGYWSAKVARNVARDQDTVARLEAAGWFVLTFWEHDDPGAAATRIAEVVRGRREPPG